MDKVNVSKKQISMKSRALENTVIAIGSNDIEQAKILEYYDPDSEKWAELLTLDIDIAYFGSAMLEGKLMIVGGRKNGDVSSLIQSYDFETGTLKRLALLKYARYLHGVVVLSRNLFVVGGYDVNYTHTVERYDPITNMVYDEEPIPTARGYFGIAVNDGEIYVIGGFNGKRLSVVESYNPILGAWKTCTSMNEIRDEPAVASIGIFIYVVGGHDGNSTLKTVERYEPAIDKWTYVESMNFPRHMCEGIDYDNSMIVAGGYDSHSIGTNIVESYKPDEWTTMASLVNPRIHFSLLKVPHNYIEQILKRSIR